jgi:hypothetical protein
MEPITMALVCAGVFGVVGVLASFIRQLLLSREKRLNDAAQQRALQQETQILEKMRYEMLDYKRYDTHYQVLGTNKESIQYIDERIDDLLKKKSEIIQRYAEAILRESSAIVVGESGMERKAICDRLKEEINSELTFYEGELEQFQKRRALLWDDHKELLKHIYEQEKSRNDHLDALYEHHSSMLEKVFLRHTDDSEMVATKTIDASTSTFRAALMAPIYYLMGLFKISSNIDPEQARNELQDRHEILKFQMEVNKNQSSTKAVPFKKLDQSSKASVNHSGDEDIKAHESSMTQKEETRVSFKSDFSI